MSKPEVVAYMWEHRGRHACVDRAYAEQLMDDGEQVAPLIRLTDYERLQAETERLQAARAADKARFADLESALKNVKRYIQSGPHGAHPALEAIGAIDAALAQQGKENVDG